MITVVIASVVAPMVVIATLGPVGRLLPVPQTPGYRSKGFGSFSPHAPSIPKNIAISSQRRMVIGPLLCRTALYRGSGRLDCVDLANLSVVALRARVYGRDGGHCRRGARYVVIRAQGVDQSPIKLTFVQADGAQ